MVCSPLPENKFLVKSLKVDNSSSLFWMFHNSGLLIDLQHATNDTSIDKL